MPGPLLDGARGVALVSLYDTENNAVRQLAAGARRAGHRVAEIYFKDWRNNAFEPPTPLELDRLAARLRSERVALVGVSLRASAYQRVAEQVCTLLRHRLAVPVVVGGWHATVRPEACIAFSDGVCTGEGDVPWLALLDALRSGDASALAAAPGWWLKDAEGISKSAPPPLVTDLDALAWRDYEHPDKWHISRGTERRGDPMADDPLWQVLCSHGCIQRCNFCHNSFDAGQAGPRLRFRSVDSVLAELAAARERNPAIRRVRFDDEIFGLDRSWLREFARRYPAEVGLPFDFLSEPTVVSDTYAELMAQAGASWVHMGIQSSEQVNRDTLERRAEPSVTRAAVERFTRHGIKIRYLVMVDIPGVTEAQHEALFAFFQEVPRPYDLYLFSLTHFPGSKLVEDQLASGALAAAQVEGIAQKTFSQYRVDLGHPRAHADTAWISALVMQSAGAVPPPLLAQVVSRRWGWDNPRALVLGAHASTLLKTALVAARMYRDGELTGTLVRRWWNPLAMITM
jgi:hypothetical protein